MSKLKMLFSLSFMAFLLIAVGCEEDEPVISTPVKVEAKTFKNLAADAATPRTNKFTLFRLSDGAIVPNTDSASTKWDLGFRATTIIVNGGTSGPGKGAAQILNGIYAELKEAPLEGYAVDANPNFAIPTGSDKGWYNYNPATNLITPLAGKVIMLRTAEGKYAKMEILSYYENAPTSPSATDKGRFYTFRYSYQTDGTRRLE
jgi:hypothetical protein